MYCLVFLFKMLCGSDYRYWSSGLGRRDILPSVVIPLTQTQLNYLLSDETRLPSSLCTQVTEASDHELIQLAENIECAFKTLCGEDVLGMDNSSTYGVVLCGAYGVIADATWATINGTIRCVDTLDVFHVLRTSCRLQQDLRLQEHISNDMLRTNDPCVLVLRKFIDIHEANVFRAFVSNGNLLGISQRSVDQVHTSLVSMTETESEKLFSKLSKAVKHFNGIFNQHVAKLCKDQDAADDVRWPQQQSLVIDLFFEGGGLPVYIMSVRCVPLLGSEDPMDPDVYSLHLLNEAPKRLATRMLRMESLDWRLFRDYAGLLRFTQESVSDNNKDDDSTTIMLTKHVYCAYTSEDLFGDADKLLGGICSSLPLELQQPDLLIDFGEEALRILHDIQSAHSPSYFFSPSFSTIIIIFFNVEALVGD